MDKQQKITIIGPGVMGEALVSRLLSNQLTEPGNIIAAGPRKDRLDELMDRYQIKTTLNNAEAVRDADVVILSIKPQK